jgi:hypothetical protein
VLLALVVAASVAGCGSTSGTGSPAFGMSSDSVSAGSASTAVGDVAVIELVAARLAEASQTWTPEQWYCVAAKLAEHTDSAILRERFLEGAPPPGPAWSEPEATSFIDALYACTPQAEVPIVLLIGLDPSKEGCIRDAFDVPKVTTFFVESVMGVGGLHEGLTSEMDRVRDVCGVPSSRVGYGSEDTVPWPIPVDE